MTKTHTTTLQCSFRTALFLLILLILLFLIGGCAAFYRAIGLTEEQTQSQLEKDQEERQKTIQQVRFTTHEIVATAIAGAGTIISTLLARWLGTERKITTALITGIEHSRTDNTKESVKTEATAAGIQPVLHRRVKALT